MHHLALDHLRFAPRVRFVPRAAGLVVVLAFAVGACGSSTTTAGATVGPVGTSPASSAGGGGGGGGGVDATESEFKIDLSASNAAAGPVSFHVTNSGSQPHEFVVIKTDTAADRLPQDSSTQTVDLTASGLSVVDQAQNIAAGASADLDVTLQPGHYVLICNIPTHYQLGMHTELTVGG